MRERVSYERICFEERVRIAMLVTGARKGAPIRKTIQVYEKNLREAEGLGAQIFFDGFEIRSS
jgi:hypothetical protein